MSADSFESRRIVCARRIVADSRELIFSREPFAVPDGKLRLLREIIQRRNIDRARRRWLRSQVSPVAPKLGPVSLKDGAVLQVLSDNENAPDMPSGASSLNPPFGPVESSGESDDAPVFGRRPLDGQTQRRLYGDLDASSPRRPQADSDIAQAVGGEGYLALRQFSE